MPPSGVSDRSGRTLKKGDTVQVTKRRALLDAFIFMDDYPVCPSEDEVARCLGEQGVVIDTDDEDRDVYIRFPWHDGHNDGHWLPALVLHPIDGHLVQHTSQMASLEWTELLYEDDNFKDVSLKLADGELRVHRCVLAARSSVFAAMFSCTMKESHTGVVEIPNVRTAPMRVFLRLLYTGLVDSKDWHGAQDVGEQLADKMPLEMLLEVAKLSKFYMVASVTTDAIQALKSRLADLSPKSKKDVDVFQTIFSAGIREDFGAMRIAAVEVAKASPIIREMYDSQRLQPEVQSELLGIWPPPPPKPKRVRRLE